MARRDCAVYGGTDCRSIHFDIAETWEQTQLLDLFQPDLFFKFAAALIAMLNPLYCVPIFIGMTREHTTAEKRRIATVVGLTVFVAATIAALIGEEILGFFGISVPAFQIAGGIIVLGIGLSMMRAEPRAAGDDKAQAAGGKDGASIAVVPLSIPLTIGPGAFVTIILFAHLLDDGSELFTMLPVIFGISFLIWIALIFAEPIARMLGETVISVIIRIMAILLTAVAVEMIINGAFHAYQNLQSASTSS